MTSIPKRKLSTVLHGSMWGVIAFFNPADYPNKFANLETCVREARRQGLKIAIAEASFEEAPYAIPEGLADLFIQQRAESVLWQKECLLNIAVAALPSNCDKVLLLDGDILFDNPSWVSQTSELLNDFVAVQPFQSAAWLKQGVRDIPRSLDWAEAASSIERILEGTGFSETKKPSIDYPRGHPGFAWAIRRGVLQQVPLYDRMILGGGDLLIAASMYGIKGEEFQYRYCTPSQVRHMSRWADAFHSQVQGSVGYCKGTVFHLWHGTKRDRRYEERNFILRSENFDPEHDIGGGTNGLLRWSSDKPRLHKRVRQYFLDRKEMG